MDWCAASRPEVLIFSRIGPRDLARARHNRSGARRGYSGTVAQFEMITVGHGTASAEAFADLVLGAGVGRIVDVRSFPGSRHNPQFKRETMAEWLLDAGVEYAWEPRLGGRRRGVGEQSRHTGLRHRSFRAYADWMETEEFTGALAETVAAARQLRDSPRAGLTALMCSETVWWRCHRRLITDHLLLIEQVPVRHLMHDGRLQEPHITPEARVVDGVVVYDGGQERLDLDEARR